MRSGLSRQAWCAHGVIGQLDTFWKRDIFQQCSHRGFQHYWEYPSPIGPAQTLTSSFSCSFSPYRSVLVWRRTTPFRLVWWQRSPQRCTYRNCLIASEGVQWQSASETWTIASMLVDEFACGFRYWLALVGRYKLQSS